MWVGLKVPDVQSQDCNTSELCNGKLVHHTSKDAYLTFDGYSDGDYFSIFLEVMPQYGKCMMAYYFSHHGGTVVGPAECSSKHKFFCRVDCQGEFSLEV